MTGYWSRMKEVHARILFHTTVGDFYFCDARNFGTLHFNRSVIEHEKKIVSLGLDLLDGLVDDAIFKQRLLKRKKKFIVETLMDQTITAGVGNYIKCEALYYSGISPHRITDTLSNDEFKKLQGVLVHVMASAYQAKGHTMSDYRDLDGKTGDFKFKLAVYKQDYDPLGNLVIKEETKDGRMTYWVPNLQT
jgi:formamidopyrimidine-DNA glycosylase